MVRVGIISGSGLDFISDISEGITLDYNKNIYGYTSSKYTLYRLGDVEIYSLKRHGDNHDINPTNVNYRSNIYGFKELCVDRIIAFGSSGAINNSYNIGSLVLLDNAIDMTKKRSNTFYDNSAIHVDMSNPFCDRLRGSIIKIAKHYEINIVNVGVGLCTEGPRLETASEIKFFKSIGADTVGMTLFPEVTLARELNLCYASIALISNYAAGISENKITVEELKSSGEIAKNSIKKLINGIGEFISYDRDCFCVDATEGAKF